MILLFSFFSHLFASGFTDTELLDRKIFVQK